MSNSFFQSGYVSANPIVITVDRKLTLNQFSTSINSNNINLKFVRKLYFYFNDYHISNQVLFLRSRNINFNLSFKSKLNYNLLYSRITSIENINNNLIFNLLNYKRKYNLRIEKLKYSFPIFYDSEYIWAGFIVDNNSNDFIINRWIDFKNKSININIINTVYKLNKKIFIDKFNIITNHNIELYRSIIRSLIKINNNVDLKSLNLKFNKYISINTNLNNIDFNFELLKSYKIFKVFSISIIDSTINLKGSFLVRIAKRVHRFLVEK